MGRQQAHIKPSIGQIIGVPNRLRGQGDRTVQYVSWPVRVRRFQIVCSPEPSWGLIGTGFAACLAPEQYRSLSSTGPREALREALKS